MTSNAFVRALALILTFASSTLTLRAQAPCDGRGNVLRPASTEAGPALGCAHAPDAPAYRLFVPAFHAIVPRAGWRLTEARTRPQLIARYRCTGLWLVPVVLQDVAVYGHVLDVSAVSCTEVPTGG